MEAATEYPVGGGGKETGSWKSRWSIRDPWRTRGAAGRCWTFSLLQTWERELPAEEEPPLFLPTPSFMASADEEKGMG